MAQKVINKALGLHTFRNELTIPDGAMVVADNVVIDRDGVVESRRGFNLHESFGSSVDRAKQILQYKDRLLVHYGTKLMFEDSGLSQFAGDYSELESGLRIKGLETSGNFYFTSDDGVKKISALSGDEFTTDAGYITDSGVPRALDNKGVCNYQTTGFLTADSVVSYQVLWGYIDANSNLNLGYPSETTVVRNVDATQTCVVDLEITIPSELLPNNPQGYFYQVYRSSIRTPYNTAPDTEFQLVIEDFPSTADLSAGFVTTQDITPEDFRVGGALLYTNPISGEGISQANSRPPLCTDIEYFKGSTFYSNTKTRHSKTLSLISVDDFISDSTKLIIGNEDQVTEYTFRGSKEDSTIDLTGYTFSALSDFDGVYFVLGAANNTRNYFAWFQTDGLQTAPAGPAGYIGIEIDIQGDTSTDEIADDIVSTLDSYIDFDVSKGGTSIVDIFNSNNGDSLNLADGSGMTALGITFTVNNEGIGEDLPTQKVLLSADPSSGIKLEESSKSLVRVVNSNSSEDVSAFYLSSSEDLPGQMYFENKTTADTPFYLAVNQTNIAANYNPTLPVAITTNTIESIDTSTIQVNWTGHGMKTGDIAVIYGTGEITGKAYAITYLTTNTFSIVATNSGTVSAEPITSFKGTEKSDNEVKPNRIYYSKDGIPEAVPALNYFNVGAKDKPIKRIIALRDSLFILKTDGVYRLSGTDVSNFSVTLFDSSSSIIAPDSVAVLNNQIYMLSTQGIIAVSEGDTSLVSRTIEEDILYPTSNNFPDFSTQSFGIASESDRSYYLFLPTDTTDTVATQCYRYNVFTKAWTRFDVAKTCGIVKKTDDKIYFGADDINYIEQERKEFLRSDYADRQYDNILLANSTPTKFQIADLNNVDVFDAVYQEQYITISRFNRLLSRLDTDPFLSYTAYRADYEASVGSSIGTLLSTLITKIDADDTTQSYTIFSATDDIDLVLAAFNTLMGELNTSLGVFYDNYRTYSDLVKYESIIEEKFLSSNSIEFLDETPFVLGSMIIYKAIRCFVEYAPENLGDTSLLKHFREATLMFDQYDFTFGKMGFRSDLSANLDSQLFEAGGQGDYGASVYGEEVYGGLSNEIPFRTYVPRNKQRCRMIYLSFAHTAARESFKLVGYSVTYKEKTTTRGYR